MAFTFGFYNSVNHDRRYNAIQMSMIFDGIIKDGIYATVGEAMILKKSDLDNTVIVAPGRGWFDHTWNYNDSDYPITGPVAELIVDRIDAIVIDINSNENSRTNKLLWVKGTGGQTPQRPTLINTADHHQYPLGYVYRKANTATINQEDITNAVGTSACPFVTGVLETIDIDLLLAQWNDQWAQFVKDYELTATNWVREQQADFLNFYNEFKLQLNQFETASEKDFTDWFNGIKDLFSESDIGELMNYVEEIDEREFLHYYGMVSDHTKIEKTSDTSTHITSVQPDTTIDTTIEKQSDGSTIITEIVSPAYDAFNYTSTTRIRKVQENSKPITDIETNWFKVAK